ncbi:LacI family transcriptional regulator [Kribbella sindirgiensis]|uniref:LacI family transcriptional regulator n=2 Tax=Kribbella sindirgiensis TaxID=1124744 RepID=A0A4R0IHX1_9ACTN|nr:LacI family transcriptional regulator [Kribbella sindirgiensis]
MSPMPSSADSPDGVSPSGGPQGDPQKASTIRDVALAAGVSKSTASRALLGQPGVSRANLEKVQRAIEQLDFVPNQIARSLSVPSPATLGLFLRSAEYPFYGHLAKGFAAEAGVRGYEVLSVSSFDQPDDANYQSLMVLAGLRAAGIVVASPVVDPLTIRRVAARVPLVLVGQMGQASNPDVPFVAPDPDDGVVLIEHVAALGHTSVALTAVAPEHSPTQWVRIERMRSHLEAQGVRNRIVTIGPETNFVDVVSGLHEAGVTAVLCNNDFAALDVLAAAAHLGLSVPGDLSVAGFDGLPPFDHEAVGLTTFRVPTAGLAAAAVDLVHKLVRDQDVERGGVFVPGELLVSRTTGPAPAR